MTSQLVAVEVLSRHFHLHESKNTELLEFFESLPLLIKEREIKRVRFLKLANPYLLCILTRKDPEV